MQLLTRLLCVVPACLFASCDGIRVRSVRSSNVVPRALQGEWTGSWSSSSLDGQGELTVQVQQFDGQPVLAVDVDNPCLVAGEYQLVLTGTTLTLRRNGAITLSGALGAEHTLAGTFTCAADEGTWHASWVRDLPPIVDLGGVWTGTIASSSAPEAHLELQLAQSVRGGVLALDGTLTLPGLVPGTMAITGSARFRGGTFDLVLVTPSGVVPNVQLAGIGDPAALTLTDGVCFTGGAPLPFTQGVVQMRWDRP